MNPTITAAAYAALRTILADESVVLVDLTTPGALLNSLAAYTVQVTPSDFGVAVAWTGRYGDTRGVDAIRYPAHPPTAPEFRTALAELVVPVVCEYQQSAQAAKLADYAQDSPGDVYEASDAIRRVEDK